MRVVTIIGFGLGALVLCLVLAWAFGHLRYRVLQGQAEDDFARLAATNSAAAPPFEAAMIADLPEIAQRYFRHAIAEGTPLHQKAQLQMRGQFLLGEKGAQKVFDMEARQVLAAPGSFVWIARMAQGPVVIHGSDGMIDGAAWTRFWMLKSLPLVGAADTPDLNLSARARPAIEAIWTPAVLLPQFGARWRQVSDDVAAVQLAPPPGGKPGQELFLRIGRDGALRAAWTRRWSEVNPQKTYHWQPFGGSVEGEARFGGFKIPGRMTAGNHFGTTDFLPFFKVEITAVRYF